MGTNNTKEMRHKTDAVESDSVRSLVEEQCRIIKLRTGMGESHPAIGYMRQLGGLFLEHTEEQFYHTRYENQPETVSRDLLVGTRVAWKPVHSPAPEQIAHIPVRCEEERLPFLELLSGVSKDDPAVSLHLWYREAQGPYGMENYAGLGASLGTEITDNVVRYGGDSVLRVKGDRLQICTGRMWNNTDGRFAGILTRMADY